MPYDPNLIIIFVFNIIIVFINCLYSCLYKEMLKLISKTREIIKAEAGRQN